MESKVNKDGFIIRKESMITKNRKKIKAEYEYDEKKSVCIYILILFRNWEMETMVLSIKGLIEQLIMKEPLKPLQRRRLKRLRDSKLK
jgi:hypothetical protein